ncbi:MAG: adenosine kinase [Candidatus Margulisiibacteriota bacterium]
MQSNKTIDLISIGNTITDLEFHVDESKLNALGIKKGSMNLIDHNKKSELISTLGSPVHQCSGGSAANSLFVANRFNLSTYHMGVIGNDPLADFTKSDYNSLNIQHSFNLTEVEGDSGCCLVLITPDGERTMMTYLGVSSQFQIGDHFDSIISEAKLILIEGYLLADDNVNELLNSTIIPLAKTHKTQLAITLSDAGLVDFFKSRFKTILDYGFDYVFANLDEAVMISGAQTIDEMIPFFMSVAIETVVTDAQNGAYTLINGTAFHHETTSKQPVDTTGAGDSFAGTYLSQRLTGESIEISGNRANEIASIVISNYGARPKALVQALHSI